MPLHGPASVSTAAHWVTIANVVRARVEAGYRPLVVHSALSGVTLGLETLASRALTRTSMHFSIEQHAHVFRRVGRASTVH
jgi:aspartokinase